MQRVIVGIVAFICLVKGVASFGKINPCDDDISNICGMAFPDTYQAIYDSRLCLKANSNIISKDCLNYVNNISPSIIEPCFTEIRNNCKAVNPGNNRMHDCLSKQTDTLSIQCLSALSRASGDEIVSNISVDKQLRGSATKPKDFDNLQSVLNHVSRYDMSSYVFLLLEDLYSQMDDVQQSLHELLKRFSSQQSEDASRSVDDTEDDDQYVTGDDDKLAKH
jgi:hypothetical protein